MTDAAAEARWFDPRDLARVEALELLASRVVDGLLAGRHRSRLKGGSAEFTEHRGYVPGDEIRLIDWKVYGKSDRYYVRQYIEQTSLQVVVVLDASGSMGFGLGTATKFDYARAVAVCLARLVLRQSDAAGLAVCGGAGARYVPPRANASHFQALLAALREIRPAGEAALASGLTDLAKRMRRRGFIVVLSDCFDDEGALRLALGHLRARGHEVLVGQVLAPEELSFDFGAWSRFECLEVEGRHLDLDPALVRQDYLENLRRFLSDLRRVCGETGCEHHGFSTARPVGEAVELYLRRRNARLKRM